MTTEAMTENGLKQAVLKVAYANGWRVKSDGQFAHRRPNKGSGVGFPDMILARDKQVMFFELKAEAGVLSAEQEGWMYDLPAFHVIRPSDWHSGRVAELLA